MSVHEVVGGSGLVGRIPCMKALILDRDGLLIENVPYLDDVRLIQPIASVREALELARAAGLRLAVVTNQSGIGRGIIRESDVERVNRCVDAELGPFDVWEVCPHAPDDGCVCRKPAPGLVLAAAGRLDLDPVACTVIGDRLTDVAAANSAGTLGVLVPSEDTPMVERRASRLVFSSLLDAVISLTRQRVEC